MTKKEMYNELVKLDKKPEKGVTAYKADELEKMLKDATANAGTPGNTGETGSIGAEGINLDDPEAIYDFLSENSGKELTPIEEYSLEELQDMFKAHFKGEDGKKETSPKPAPAKVKVPKNLILRLKSSGWCEALGKSYFRGIHKCTSQKEYEALKKYAE